VNIVDASEANDQHCAVCGGAYSPGQTRCECCGSPLVAHKTTPWRKRRRRPTGTAQEATERAGEA
jgi:predicted amidophosphoribosyltransferase